MFHANGLQSRFLPSHVLAWAVAMLACGILWAAGAVTALDNFLYDRCLSVSLSQETATSVLLVSASKETLKSPLHRELLVSRLDRLGATGIAFSAPIDKGNSAEDVGPTKNAWVIVPSGYFDDRFSSNPYSETPSSTGEEKRILAGFPRQKSGVLRWQSVEFSDEGGPASSLEASIAEQWFDGSWTPPQGDFLINYSRGGAHLPLVPAGVVLNDGLIPELVQGRVVLIGRERDLTVPGLTVPLHTYATLTPLEVHGHAVNSLLTQTWISVPSTWQSLAIVVFASLAVYLAGQRRAGQESRLYPATAILGIELLAGWAALHYGNCWIPLGWLWCAQMTTWLACAGQSRWALKELVARATYHTRTRLRLCATQAEPASENSAAKRKQAFSAASSTAAELNRELDSLHFQFNLLESVFDQTGIGLAIYDANGALLRINRSLSAAVAKSNALDSLSRQDEIRRAVKSAIQDQVPVTLTLPAESRNASYEVVARPIELRWSSPLATIPDSNVSRLMFVICEGNAVSKDSPSKENAGLGRDKLIETLALIEREFGSDIQAILPGLTEGNSKVLFPSGHVASNRPANHVLASEIREATDE